MLPDPRPMTRPERFSADSADKPKARRRPAGYSETGPESSRFPAAKAVSNRIAKEKKMAEGHTKPNGPDLAKGIALADLTDGGKLVGHCGDEQVLLVRRGTEVFAVSPTCTHYGGPLADGLVVDDTVRCPWHHACFDLRTGEALRAPAFSPLACWSVEQRDGKIFVGEKRKRVAPKPRDGDPTRAPDKIVIVGGGAAGFAAAEKLRRERYQGSIVMLSDDRSATSRSPQSFQGLPRRQGAGGLDSAARAKLLLKERYRPASRDECSRHRCRYP